MSSDNIGQGHSSGFSTEAQECSFLGVLAVKADIRTTYFCMYCTYANVCAYIISANFPHSSDFYDLISIYGAYTLVVFRAVFRLPLSLSSSTIWRLRAPLSSLSGLHQTVTGHSDRVHGMPELVILKLFLPPILDANKSFLIIPLRGGTIFYFPPL